MAEPMSTAPLDCLITALEFALADALEARLTERPLQRSHSPAVVTFLMRSQPPWPSVWPYKMLHGEDNLWTAAQHLLETVTNHLVETQRPHASYTDFEWQLLISTQRPECPVCGNRRQATQPWVVLRECGHNLCAACQTRWQRPECFMCRRPVTRIVAIDDLGLGGDSCHLTRDTLKDAAEMLLAQNCLDLHSWLANQD